ncbi:MAG TPA: DinB family protein [Bryobacteraceae bacterium]|nr:DinB family protein [Bryobacteraceae bacterium]
MQPDQATFLLNIFLPALQREQGTTKRVIAAIPADKGDFRPDEFARPAIELAWHIAMVEMRFLDAVINAVFDLSPRPRPESMARAADIAAWYDTEFAMRAAAVAALSPEALTKIVDFRGMFQLPAVMYLDFIRAHTIHHRGQLSTYLRPMGAKVPAIYGESYDSAQARSAAK